MRPCGRECRLLDYELAARWALMGSSLHALASIEAPYTNRYVIESLKFGLKRRHGVTAENSLGRGLILRQSGCGSEARASCNQ
jgi:hypothetical protein